MTDRPAQSVSPWMAAPPLPNPGPLDRDLHADVCIVGAGIAGLSIAYELVQDGRTVIVIDAAHLAGGETSRTTAHLSSVLDARYYEIERLHGEDGARHAAESHTAAIDRIERIVKTESIDCDFTRLDGYLFRDPNTSDDVLEREIELCQRAGLLAVGWADRAPIDGIDTGRCLRFARQGQFHPLKYLNGLVTAILKAGGRIFTHTAATRIEGGKDGGSGRVQIGDGGPVITAGDLVVATEVPVNDLLTMHTKQYPYRTWSIAAHIPTGSVFPALLWDTAKPYHYVRIMPQSTHDLLLVGGEDHKTGQADNGEDRHRLLEEWARQRFPSMGRIAYHWSGQIIEPMDSLAFIGRNPGDENVWIVTGTSGNGMTYGALAGVLIRDLILDRDNPWAKVYEPSRKSLRAALEFAQENLNMVAQYADWLTKGDVKDESEIAAGQGAIVRHGSRKLAVYRDAEGNFHRCSAVCPHLGAIVRWNAEEHSWDCPAHGSRYDAYGRVINGPAIGGLSPADAAEARDETPASEPASPRAEGETH